MEEVVKSIELGGLLRDTHTFNVVLPNGQTHPDVTITVRSEYNQKFKALTGDLYDETQHRKQKVKPNSKNSSDVMSPEDRKLYEEIGLRTVAARVEKMSGITNAGVNVGSDRDQILKALSDNPWLVEQITEVSSGLVNFCAE